MVCCRYFKSLDGVDVDVLDFKLSFDEGILALFRLATVLASISKIWANFSQSSGHPGSERS